MNEEKEFYLDAYDFICSLMEYVNRISNEMTKISIDNYRERFSTCKETISRLGEQIMKFVNKWNCDDEKVCSTLRTIKEYYEFYRVTFSSSSNYLYERDANYIIESIGSSKLILSHKLKMLKSKIC